MQPPSSIPVALLRVSRSGVTSFEPGDYIGHTPNLVYVQLLTHPDQYTYWFDADKEPKVQELVKASIKDATAREVTRRHILRTSPRKTRDPLTGPWGVQTTQTHQFDALANVVVKGKKVIKDDPYMVPPFQGWHTETRMPQAKDLIARVVEGESPARVAEGRPLQEMYSKETFKIAQRLVHDSSYRAQVKRMLDHAEKPIQYSNEDFDREQQIAGLLHEALGWTQKAK